MSDYSPNDGDVAIQSIKDRLAQIARLESEVNLFLPAAGIRRRFFLLGNGQLLHELEELEFARRVSTAKQTGAGTLRRTK